MEAALFPRALGPGLSVEKTDETPEMLKIVEEKMVRFFPVFFCAPAGAFPYPSTGLPKVRLGCSGSETHKGC